MILSRRLPRSFRQAMTFRSVDRVRPGGTLDQVPEAAPRTRRDPDWAIREIVDDAMFEPLR